jgi:heterodisulfide reductase subunit B2
LAVGPRDEKSQTGRDIHLSLRNQHSWLDIAARNLTAAEEKGADLITICDGCYGTLEVAHRYLSKHPESVTMVIEKLSAIGMSYRGTSKVVHFVDVLDQMLPQIISKIKVELGLKVAIHYGC